MKNNKAKYLAILAAVVLAGVCGAAVIDRSPKVAIVNVNTVIESLQENKDRLAVYKKFYDEKNSELRRISDEIDVLKKKLTLLNPDNKEYKETEQKLLSLNTDRKAKSEAAQMELVQKKLENFLQLYEIVNSEIRKYCDEKGIDIVLSIVPPTKGKRINSKKLIQDIMMRRVLYYNSDFEITAIIADRLNKAYAKKQKGKK